MRYCVLILLLFISLPVSAQNVTAPAVTPDDHSRSQGNVTPKGILIRDITIEGFVLGDKNQFVKLFKPYRNKYLATADMDEILQKIQVIYEREGYLQLVTITYQVIKHRLVFTALMTT